MEKFGYSSGWKRAKAIAIVRPIIFLLGLGALWVLLVLPGDAEFKWWIPLAVIALIGWAGWEIAKYREALAYAVELSEDFIRVGGEQASWADVVRVEFKQAILDAPAIILHTKAGKSLFVAAATDSIQYVKGYIEGHANQAVFS